MATVVQNENGESVDVSTEEWQAAIAKELKAHETVFRLATQADFDPCKNSPMIPAKLLYILL